MNGEDSTKEIFKTQPKLRVYNYQGSLTSTSEGIKKVFDNARKGIVKYKPNLQLIQYHEVPAEINQNDNQNQNNQNNQKSKSK